MAHETSVDLDAPEWPFSQAAARLKPSATNATAHRARELKASGRDIIALSTGEPDFPTPDHIIDAAAQAMRDGHTRYTSVGGTPEMKDAIRHKFQTENGLTFDRSEVMASSGGKQVIANAMLATLNPGDEVIIPAPYWVSYPELVTFCGGVPVTLPTSRDTGFCVTAEAVAAAMTPRTKWLVLNSPCNPSGAVFPAETLQEIATLLDRHPQVHVLSDDIYEHLIYSGQSFRTLAELAPHLSDRILTMNGVSKAYAMTGWRIGFAGGPAALIKTMEKIQGQTTSNPNAVAQCAAAAALTGSKAFMEERRISFQRRRDLVIDRIARMDGLTCPTPNGAFYVFPACDGLFGTTTPAGRAISTDQDFCEALLEEAEVAVVFGSAFGLPGHFRISYATSDDALSKACDRIETFCANLRHG